MAAHITIEVSPFLLGIPRSPSGPAYVDSLLNGKKLWPNTFERIAEVCSAKLLKLRRRQSGLALALAAHSIAAKPGRKRWDVLNAKAS